MEKLKTTNHDLSSVGSSRISYLDNFRIFLIITVIFHHATLAYGGTGAWGYMEGATDSISPFFLALFNAVNQAFFMSSFFFLAGYFTPRSLDKKGAVSFLLDRVIRLSIPLVFYTLLIVNLNSWILDVFVRGIPFQWRLVYSPDHLWFLQNLLVFSIVYVIFRLIRGRTARRQKVYSRNTFPTDKVLILCIAVIGLLTFLIRIEFPVNRWAFRVQPAHLIHYIFSFSVGILAYRRDWLSHLSNAIGRRWGWITLSMIPAFYALFIFGGVLKEGGDLALFLGGFHWQAFGYALWDTVMMIAMNIFLISLFQQKYNRGGAIVKTMAANVFTVYIIHRTVLLAVQIAMRGFGIPSILKFLISGILTTLVCFLLSAAIRKMPFVKRVLG